MNVEQSIMLTKKKMTFGQKFFTRLFMRSINKFVSGIINNCQEMNVISNRQAHIIDYHFKKCLGYK